MATVYSYKEAESKRNELREKGVRQNNKINNRINNNNTNDNNNNNNSNDVSIDNSNSNQATGRAPVANNPRNNDNKKGNKAQKNNTSLVREGKTSLGDKRPRAKVQPTRRTADPSIKATTDTSAGQYGTVDVNRNEMTRDGGDVDPYKNSSGGVDDTTLKLTNGDHRYSDNYGSGAPTTGVEKGSKYGGKKDKSNTLDPPSVRQRFYETADMDDVLQAKIATQLRENGIAEIKVTSLSAKIAQAVRDDVMSDRKGSNPQVISNLSSTVNDHLDIILHNYSNHTDLSHVKATDATELSQMVLLRVGQVRDELELCKSSVDSALVSKRGDHDNTVMAGTTPRQGVSDDTGGTTPRDHQERSMVMAIKEGLDAQKTENQIMEDKLKRLESENEEIEELKQRHAQEIQLWDDENLQLKKYLGEADQDNETLVSKVKEQQQENDKLQKSLTNAQKEVQRLKKQIDELISQGHLSGKELAALQSEKARLQVLCDQRQKEIVHLRDPDRDLLHQIRVLSDEVTTLRTQTRRLTEEKGMLKAKGQKMESALDESLKHRNKITSERDVLFKENQDIRQKYRKLTLATPAQRTLPEIMTPRTRPASRSTTLLSNSRANSKLESNVLVVKNSMSEDGSSTSRLPTHTEEEEQETAALSTI